MEILLKNHAVENLIREGKTYQLDNVIETSLEQGMISMDRSLAELVKGGIISLESALTYAKDQKYLQSML